MCEHCITYGEGDDDVYEVSFIERVKAFLLKAKLS